MNNIHYDVLTIICSHLHLNSVTNLFMTSKTLNKKIKKYLYANYVFVLNDKTNHFVSIENALCTKKLKISCNTPNIKNFRNIEYLDIRCGINMGLSHDIKTYFPFLKRMTTYDINILLLLLHNTRVYGFSDNIKLYIISLLLQHNK